MVTMLAMVAMVGIMVRIMLMIPVPIVMLVQLLGSVRHYVSTDGITGGPGIVN